MMTKHGLPKNVIFCKTCLMSNQRPSSSPEFLKKSSVIDTAGFGKDGICDACKYAEMKKRIDWDERLDELSKLCDRFRKGDGSYDVVVPGSGGKDSIFVAHYLKHEMGMNPLTVTWAPHEYTDVGLRNMRNWLSSGFANITVTPDATVHSQLTRSAFQKLVNPFQPFIIGQRNIAPKIALQEDIKFIMYGENQAEAHNHLNENFSSLMDHKHFTANANTEIFLGGKSISEWRDLGIKVAHLHHYMPIAEDVWKQSQTEVHYMSYFINWSPNNNYYYAKEYCNFERNPTGRSEGTYTRYSSLDDKLDGQHYYTMFIKFGQGRAMNDANRDIRDGYITRSEGLELVKKYDGELPKEHFQWALDYMDITEDEYWQIIDNARSPHLWQKSGHDWLLLHPTE